MIYLDTSVTLAHLLAEDRQPPARTNHLVPRGRAKPPEIGRLHGQHDRFWQARYASILITEEPEAQIARLRYFLEQGCKENLVSSPRHWPGIHMAQAILSGRPMEGIWIDRAGFTNASRCKGKTSKLIDFHKKETLTLSPLPCWAHLSPEAYRQKVRDIIEEIEKETAERHRINNTKPADRRAVLRKSPRHKSKRPKKRPCPSSTPPPNKPAKQSEPPTENSSDTSERPSKA